MARDVLVEVVSRHARDVQVLDGGGGLGVGVGGFLHFG
jgi:hypothetical protein